MSKAEQLQIWTIDDKPVIPDSLVQHVLRDGAKCFECVAVTYQLPNSETVAAAILPRCRCQNCATIHTEMLFTTLVEFALQTGVDVLGTVASVLHAANAKYSPMPSGTKPN